MGFLPLSHMETRRIEESAGGGGSLATFTGDMADGTNFTQLGSDGFDGGAGFAVIGDANAAVASETLPSSKKFKLTFSINGLTGSTCLIDFWCLCDANDKKVAQFSGEAGAHYALSLCLDATRAVYGVEWRLGRVQGASSVAYATDATDNATNGDVYTLEVDATDSANIQITFKKGVTTLISYTDTSELISPSNAYFGFTCNGAGTGTAKQGDEVTQFDMEEVA